MARKEEQDCRQTRFAQRRYDNDKIVRHLVRINSVGMTTAVVWATNLVSFQRAMVNRCSPTLHVELLPVITKHSMVIQNRRMPKINPVHCCKTVLILYLGAMNRGMISCSEGKILMFLVSIHRRLGEAVLQPLTLTCEAEASEPVTYTVAIRDRYGELLDYYQGNTAFHPMSALSK